MPQLWQCDVCGTRYRVAWLSHCYRCEGAPPKQKPKPEKPSRRKRMPRIVAGVGPSNANEVQPEVIEDAPVVAEPEAEPVAAPVEPEPVVDAAPVAPEPVAAPVAVQAAPVVAPKGGAA
jgi:hypothetical protein